MLKQLLFAACLLLSACNPLAAPTPTPAPKPIPLDATALYQKGLTSAAQNDLAQLDRVTQYKLAFTYTANPPTLTGTEDVVYFNKRTEPLREIYFRLFANYSDSGKIDVSHITLNNAAVTPSLEEQNTVLRVPLAQPLAPNASVNLHLEFKIAIPTKNDSHYADFIATDQVVTLPTVYPLIPAYDANGWHIELPPPFGDVVYADIAQYDVSVTAPDNYQVIASGSTIDVQKNSDGTRTWRMVGAPMRDFDINLSSQLQLVSAVVGETTINSYYEPHDATNGKKALQIAADAFKTFEALFGAYPYRELDVVETPTTAGGIEYPGIVVIARRLYSDPQTQDFFEFATAHEVAHQWWYGVVGNDQVNHPWLDEALAQYSTVIYYEKIRGARAGSTVLQNVLQARYSQTKKEGRDQPVDQPVGAFNEGDYSAIVYAKGGLFFDALRKQMGDDKFFRFLQTYFTRYKYRIALPDDLVKTAEEVNGASIREIYQQWILSAAK